MKQMVDNIELYDINVSNMETNRLRQFCTVYEISNLRQSAEIIGMTHGALSKSIKVLEEELGLQLFIPDGRGIVATKEAGQVYIQAKKIIEEVDKLTLRSSTENKSLFRIASFEVFTTYFLNYLKKDLDFLDLELHELVQGQLEHAVKENLVDLGITYEPIPTPNVDFLSIKTIKSSPYVGYGYFKNTKTLEIPFAAPIRPIVGAPTGAKGLDGWPEHLFPRKIKYKVDMMESAIQLCRAGHCAIFIPDFIAKTHNQFVKKEFSLQKISYPQGMKPVERSIYLVKRKNSPETPQMKKITRYLRSI